MSYRKSAQNSRKKLKHGGAGWNAIVGCARTADQIASGLARWITTDHTGIGKALENMPKMGFVDSMQYILLHLLIAISGAVFMGLGIFLLLAFGIPFLITGTF
jgi:hypothetical protein